MRLDDALEAFRKALAEGEEEGLARTELTKKTVKIFADPARAFRISQTEGARALNGGQFLAAKESGIVSAKEWIASSDACDLCLELDGVQVPLDEDFAYNPKGGHYARTPYPPLHPACMCAWSEVI